MPTTPIAHAQRAGPASAAPPRRPAGRPARRRTGTRGDEQPGQRAGQRLLGVGEQQPRPGHLQHGEQQQRPPVPQRRAQLAPSRSSRAAAAPRRRRSGRTPRTTGDTSSTATLISRYGMPQITDMARNSAQPRRLTPRPARLIRHRRIFADAPRGAGRPTATGRRRRRSASASGGCRTARTAGPGTSRPRPGSRRAGSSRSVQTNVECSPRGSISKMPGPADEPAGVLHLDQPRRLPLRDDHRVEDADVPAAGQRQPGARGQPAVQPLGRAADRRGRRWRASTRPAAPSR